MLMSGIIDLDPTIDVTPFIDMANEIVTDVCIPLTRTLPAVPAAPVYSSHRLELIETWLSCHFYESRDKPTNKEHVGPLSVGYQGKWGFGFELTRYGQAAMRLDTANRLAALNNTQKTIKGTYRGPTGVVWLGLPVEAQYALDPDSDGDVD